MLATTTLDLPICTTCGTQFGPTQDPKTQPFGCRICAVRRIPSFPYLKSQSPFLHPLTHHPPGSPSIRPPLRHNLHHPNLSPIHPPKSNRAPSPLQPQHLPHPHHPKIRHRPTLFLHQDTCRECIIRPHSPARLLNCRFHQFPRRIKSHRNQSPPLLHYPPRLVRSFQLPGICSTGG